MEPYPRADVTGALIAMRSGRAVDVDHFWSIVNEPLRRMAHRLIGARFRRGGMIQTTAVVNEAWCRLVDRQRTGWKDRAHFYAVAAKVMRRSLIDWIRSETRQKRGGQVCQLPLELAGDLTLREGLSLEDVLALDEALQELAARDPRSAAVVELRCFGGLSVHEIGAVLGIATRTVDKDWHFARGWLHRRLDD